MIQWLRMQIVSRFWQEVILTFLSFGEPQKSVQKNLHLSLVTGYSDKLDSSVEN